MADPFNDGSVPGVIDDGDWSVESACSTPVLEYPFSDRGDQVSYLVHQRFQVAAAAFVPLAPLTRHPLYPDALLVEEGPQRDLGGGKIEWERIWASVPVSRQEPESYIYPFQTLLVATTNDNGGVSQSGTLGTVPLTVDSTVTYDYFVPADLGGFALAEAPRIIELTAQAFFKIGTGDLSFWGAFQVSTDALILAENDTYGRYRGLIQFRKRRQITGPTAGFWGSTLNLTKTAQAAGTANGTVGTPASGNVGTVGLVIDFTVAPATVYTNSTTRLTLTGIGTAWTADTTFRPLQGTLSNLVVDVAAQTATATYTAPAIPGGYVLFDGPTSGAGITVLQGPTLTAAPASVTANSTTTITLAGTGTAWTPGTGFAASAGTVAAVSVDVAAQTVTFVFTAPNRVGPVTFTGSDHSSGTLDITIF